MRSPLLSCIPPFQSSHKHKKRKSHLLLAIAMGSKAIVWNFSKGEEERTLVRDISLASVVVVMCTEAGGGLCDLYVWNLGGLCRSQ